MLHIPDQMDNRDEHAGSSLVERIQKARTDFFVFVTTCDSDGKHGNDVHHESLWWFFDAWLSKQYAELETRFYLDPATTDTHWRQFLAIVPSIYLAIISRYLHDPSLIDYVEHDPDNGKNRRIERRVSSVLPLATEELEAGIARSPEEFERASLTMLVRGADLSWPLVNFGRSESMQKASTA